MPSLGSDDPDDPYASPLYTSALGLARALVESARHYPRTRAAEILPPGERVDPAAVLAEVERKLHARGRGELERELIRRAVGEAVTGEAPEW